MADIGQTLREARMRSRIDISEVEARTKIRARYLRAIENEEWDLLPGPVYIKSFLRTYADYLGLDSRLLVDEFKRRYERPSDHEVRPAGTLRRERERERDRDRPARGPRGPLVPPWAIIGLVLVGVVVALYLIGSGTGNNKPSPTGAHNGRHRHRPPASTTRTTPPRRHLPPRVAKLRLVPTGTIYVCVEKPSGQRLVAGTTFALGQTIPIVKGRELYVVLGNNLVHMTVNGKPYPVAPSSTAIDLKVLPTGVTPLAPAQVPTCA